MTPKTRPPCQRAGRSLSICVFSFQRTRLQANGLPFDIVAESKAPGADTILAVVRRDRFEFLDWVLATAIVRVGSKRLKDTPKDLRERFVRGGRVVVVTRNPAVICVFLKA